MSSCEEDKPSAGQKMVDKSNIKCVLVGDCMVGKTCLAKRLAAHAFPAVYTPTMFDNYATTTTIDGKSFVLGLFDTAGQEEFDRLRTLAYVNCDVFLICFSVLVPESLRHVQDGWMREVRSHAPHVPCVLVGTHIDLRDDDLKARGGRKSSLAGGPAQQQQYVNTKDGEAAAHRMGAESYVECSSLTDAGILRLKEAAVDAVLSDPSSPREDGCRCACSLM
ncbi:cell division control protein 42 homolog [Babylonia areolata]|uniref:cell division control protein 42 homolog n=1 Tax=Babylonia areolata TaxID=304850 RepID=UPI003FD2CEE2